MLSVLCVSMDLLTTGYPACMHVVCVFCKCSECYGTLYGCSLHKKLNFSQHSCIYNQVLCTEKLHNIQSILYVTKSRWNMWFSSYIKWSSLCVGMSKLHAVLSEGINITSFDDHIKDDQLFVLDKAHNCLSLNTLVMQSHVIEGLHWFCHSSQGQQIKQTNFNVGISLYILWLFLNFKTCVTI